MLIARAASAAILVVVIAGIASAQTDSPLPSRPVVVSPVAPVGESPAEILSALQHWTADYGEWKVWFDKWRGIREPGWWKTRERRVAPAPPAWLPEACAAALDAEGPMGDACQLWRGSKRDLEDEAAALAAQRVAQARANLEAPQKSMWWSRVHLDAIWPMSRSGTSAMGVFGVHTTTPVGGRFQIFLAPGFLFMRLPSPDGHSVLTAATDWGFSVRLTDIRLPAVRRASTLHFNMARVWVLGTSAAAVGFPGDLYVAGFSLTFKNR